MTRKMVLTIWGRGLEWRDWGGRGGYLWLSCEDQDWNNFIMSV